MKEKAKEMWTNLKKNVTDTAKAVKGQWDNLNDKQKDVAAGCALIGVGGACLAYIIGATKGTKFGAEMMELYFSELLVPVSDFTPEIKEAMALVDLPKDAAKAGVFYIK